MIGFILSLLIGHEPEPPIGFDEQDRWVARIDHRQHDWFLTRDLVERWCDESRRDFDNSFPPAHVSWRWGREIYNDHDG